MQEQPDRAQDERTFTMSDSEYREIIEQAVTAIREKQESAGGATEDEPSARERITAATLAQLEQYPALTLSVKDVSKLGGWSDRTTTRLCLDGKLKAVRVQGMWRINKMAFLDFVEGR